MYYDDDDDDDDDYYYYERYYIWDLYGDQYVRLLQSPSKVRGFVPLPILTEARFTRFRVSDKVSRGYQ